MIPSHTLPLEALDRLAAPRSTPPGRESYPQGPNCLREAKVVEFVAQIGSLGVSAMSDRGSGAGQTVVPLGTQSNVRSQAGDPLDAAGKAILGSLHRAASAAEANYQQALEMTDKLSAGLRAAEDRIRELEAKSGITRTEQTGPRSGCIKSRLKLSRNSFLAEVGHRSSHRLHKHFPEIRDNRVLRTRHRQFD